VRVAMTFGRSSCDSIWQSRERSWNQTKGARRKRVLVGLREAFKEGEIALVGWANICGYLNFLGLRNREGRPVTIHAVRGWMRRLHFPLLRGRPGRKGRWRHSQPLTTNYLVLSWLASLYRGGGPDLPRIALDSSDDSSIARSPAWPPYVKGVRFGVAGVPPPAGPATGPRKRGLVVGMAPANGASRAPASVAPSSSASAAPRTPPARRIRIRQPGYNFGRGGSDGPFIAR
jgi:hypothetical protein